MKSLKDERGFMLLSIIFLTVIISFAAAILINAGSILKTSQSTLRLTAIHLANEQFAELESRAVAGNLSTGKIGYLGLSEDLTTKNLGQNNPITFSVKTEVSNGSHTNMRKAKVTVEWNFDGKNSEVEFEKNIRLLSE